MTRLRAFLNFLIIALVAAVLVVPWHSTNHKLPHFDAADFAVTALRIDHAMDDGVLAGTGAMYGLRDWRPILFPPIAAPFFRVTGGHLRAGIAATQLALLLCAGLYALALARRFLPRGLALLAATFVMSLPWVVGFATIFYAELAWLAGTAGWLYHTVAADGCRVRRHAILSGVFLAIMICVRPVETAIVVLPVLLLFAALDWRRGTISWSGFSIAIAAGVALAVAWWAPFAKALYDWAYAASFGALALTTDQRYRGAGVLTVLRDAAAAYAPHELTALAVTAIVGGAASLRSPRTTGGARAPARRPGDLVLAALVMLAPIVAVLMLTGTSSYRRFVPAFFVAFVALTIVALNPAPMLRRLRVAAVAGLTAFQFLLIVTNGLGARPAFLASAYDAFLDNIARPDPSPDVCESVVDAMTSAIAEPDESLIAAHTLCYFDELAGCSFEHVPWFEPSALNAVALSRRAPLRFASDNQLDPQRPDRFAQHLHDAGFRYVLLDRLDRPAMHGSPIPYVAGTSGLIVAATKDGRIAGLVPIRRYILGAREVVLFRVAPEIVDTPAIATARVEELPTR